MKKKFLILWLAGIASTALGMPYIFTLQASVIAQASLSFPVIVLISLVQIAVFLAVAIYFGLRLSTSIGLRVFALENAGTALREKIYHILGLSVPLGIATALIIKFLDYFFAQRIPELSITLERIAFWKAILVAPYGGVVEEILLRLFVVTLFAWLIAKIFRVSDAVKNSTLMWIAIVAASILFGLGHLPATSTFVALSPLVIFRALLLNGIGGLVFGWLYWKKGLEYAIVAHFSTDVVLHALLPLLLH